VQTYMKIRTFTNKIIIIFEDTNVNSTL
jgi:hypothetical protein